MTKKDFYTARGYQIKQKSACILSPSLEDYLEMITRSIATDGKIRVKDLADKLHVRPPSASKMLQKLSDLGLLDYVKYGEIKLTSYGQELGNYLLWRHKTINEIFELIGQNKEQNFIEAELVEHILSEETVQVLACILHFFKERPKIYTELKDYLRLSPCFNKHLKL